MRARNTALFALLIVAGWAGWAGADEFPDVVGRHAYGVNEAVAAQGTTAYVGSGAVLVVVNLADPSVPAVVGRLELPSLIAGIVASGDRVYAMIADSVVAIDVTDPSAPAVLGSLSRGDSYYFGAFGDTMCLIGGSSPWGPSATLTVVDFADPADPNPTGSLSIPRYVDAVEVLGNHALLASENDLVVVDVSPAAEPTVVAILDLGQGIDARFLDVAGGLALIGGGQAVTAVDVSTPTSPIALGSLEIPDGVNGLAVYGSLAFIRNTSGVRVIDISDPALPQMMGTAVPQDWDGYVGAMAAVDGVGLAATPYRGVRVIDAGDPSQPEEVARVDAPGVSAGIAYCAGTLAVAADRRGLRLVDVSDPGAQEDRSILDLGGASVKAVAVRGETVYAVGTSLWVISITDPTHPEVLGETPAVNGGNAIRVVGDRAYVAENSFGLRVVDVSNPTQPMVIGELELDGHWYTIDAADEIAVLGGGLETAVVDVTNPAAPVQIASLSDPFLSTGVALQGSLLLSGDYGTPFPILRIHDLTDPANPVELSALPIPTLWIRFISLSGSVAYLGTHSESTAPAYINGVVAVGIGDPTAPAILGSYDIWAASIEGLALSDDHVFLSRSSEGVDILSQYTGQLFADDFESGTTSAWSGGGDRP